mgnify:FL=1
MKYLLILYMCSMNTGKCPSYSYSGHQFNSHYDCVMGGYAVAQSTFKNLEETMEWDQEYINQNKIVIKFECKKIEGKTT